MNNSLLTKNKDTVGDRKERHGSDTAVNASILFLVGLFLWVI